MKVHLEFEDDDLESMLLEHFEKAGFRVKNLEELCAQFRHAFPEGIRVSAETIRLPEPEPSFEPAPEPAPPPSPAVVPPPAPLLVVEDAPQPAIALCDLLDPTLPPAPPFDPLKEDENAAVYRLIKESRTLESRAARKK